jgi:hypothetical protein
MMIGIRLLNSWLLIGCSYMAIKMPRTFKFEMVSESSDIVTGILCLIDKAAFSHLVNHCRDTSNACKWFSKEV